MCALVLTPFNVVVINLEFSGGLLLVLVVVVGELDGLILISAAIIDLYRGIIEACLVYRFHNYYYSV